MGNNKSSKEEGTVAPSSTEGTTTAVAGVAKEEQPHLEIAGMKKASAPKNRRIVKAMHPSSSKTAAATSSEEFTKASSGDDDDDDDGYEKVGPHAWRDSDPSVAREIEQEIADSQKHQRISQAVHRRQVSREKTLQQKRQQNKSAPKNAAVAAASPTANPMSHFLSAFSIDSHPEHKRKLRLYDEHVDKRPRPNDDNDGDKAPSWWKQRSTFVTSIAVAIAAVVVGFVLQQWTTTRNTTFPRNK